MDEAEPAQQGVAGGTGAQRGEFGAEPARQAFDVEGAQQVQDGVGAGVGAEGGSEMAGEEANWSGSLFSASRSYFGPAFTTVKTPSREVQ